MKRKWALKALGEVLTIKLIEKLREEESGVYGVGARGRFSKLHMPRRRLVFHSLVVLKMWIN